MKKKTNTKQTQTKKNENGCMFFSVEMIFFKIYFQYILLLLFNFSSSRNGRPAGARGRCAAAAVGGALAAAGRFPAVALAPGASPFLLLLLLLLPPPSSPTPPLSSSSHLPPPTSLGGLVGGRGPYPHPMKFE